MIVLSARAGEEAAIEGLEAGADDYLPKPFSGRDLIARVRANIELRAGPQRRRRPAARGARGGWSGRSPSRSAPSALLAVQRDVLTMVAAGTPLERTLEEVVHGAEALLAEHGARACLRLRGEDGEQIEIGSAAERAAAGRRRSAPPAASASATS